ncbi:MAG: TIGR02186 family protein [Pseudomonadota bacterium]
MAQEQAALYGLASILLALVAGWLASTLFRLLLP